MTKTEEKINIRTEARKMIENLSKTSEALGWVSNNEKSYNDLKKSIDVSRETLNETLTKILEKDNLKVEVVNQKHNPDVQKVSGRVTIDNQIDIPDVQKVEVTNGSATTNQQVYVGGRQYSIYNEYLPNRRTNSQYRLAQGSIGTTFLPAISFRRKSTFESVSVKVEGFDLITDADLVYQLRLNASLTSPTYATPTDTTAAETACEVDVSASAVSGGELLYEGLVAASGSGNTSKGSSSETGLYIDIPSVQPITLCIRRVSGTGATVSSVLRWREEW